MYLACLAISQANITEYQVQIGMYNVNISSFRKYFNLLSTNTILMVRLQESLVRNMINKSLIDW